MKIALVTHNVVRGDGQGRANFELVRQALRAGHQVLLVSDRVSDELLNQGARWLPTHPFLRRPLLFKVPDMVLRANAHLRNRPGWVVVANGYTLSTPHDLNVLHFVHGADWQAQARRSLFPRGPAAAYYHLYDSLNRAGEKRALSMARNVVAVSEKVKLEATSLGVPEDRVTVIPNGVDIHEFRPGTASRGDQGLPEGVPLALFVGDIRSRRKNLDTALEALQGLPRVHLAVAGSTRGSPYPALARQLGVGRRVTFLGYVNDVPRLMRAVDVLIAVSWYDPFSLAVIEGLASGLPVITATTVGAAELVTEAGGIVLTRPDDVRALGTALQQLSQDHALRARLGRAGRNVAIRYTWERTTASYLDLLERISA